MARLSKAKREEKAARRAAREAAKAAAAAGGTVESSSAATSNTAGKPLESTLTSSIEASQAAAGGNSKKSKLDSEPSNGPARKKAKTAAKAKKEDAKKPPAKKGKAKAKEDAKKPPAKKTKAKAKHDPPKKQAKAAKAAKNALTKKQAKAAKKKQERAASKLSASSQDETDSKPNNTVALASSSVAPQKTNTSTSTTASKPVNPTLLQHAKNRLSKWAARLFDVNRPRGLVQAPEIIPLNDEYLQAFGKRVKQEQQGKPEEIVESDDNGENSEDEMPLPAKPAAKKDPKNQGTKVKISNLPYRTDVIQIQRSCEKYGDLLDVNLIMNPNDPKLNAGRAYVVFYREDDAQRCIEDLTEMSNRSIKVTFAEERSKPSTSSNSQSLLNRYWDKDISLVCYRCGKVGHYEADCTNPPKPKPCFMCGKTDHNGRNCIYRQICFNCGEPGHVVSQCPERRGQPRQVICGICFSPGHDKFSCHRFNYMDPNILRDAQCMVCGKRGSFLCCQQVRWFFGLPGISCFNCGGTGHLGYHCNRPNLRQCREYPDVAMREINRAEASSVAEQLQQAQQPRRGREAERDNRSRGYNRPKSMPPSRHPPPRGDRNPSAGGRPNRQHRR